MATRLLLIAVLLGILGFPAGGPVRAESERPLAAAPQDEAAVPEGDEGEVEADAEPVGGGASEEAAAKEASRRFVGLRVDPVKILSRSGEPASRVHELAQVSFELGLVGLDAAARAVAGDERYGDPVTRAEAAILLSPDLPEAHYERAQALLADLQPAQTVAAWWTAVRSLARHEEARAWLRPVLSEVLRAVAFLTGALYLVVAAGAALAGVGARLDRNRGGVPISATMAGGFALILLPTLFGHGAVGIVFGSLFVIGAMAVRGRALVAPLAAALVFAALGPLTTITARGLAALRVDPVAEASQALYRSFADEAVLARLHRGAHDASSIAALAIYEKRRGDLESASRRFDRLLEETSEPTAAILNNAANVELLRGDVEDAIALYERAAVLEASADVLFNLSQAYGQAIRLEEQDLALAEAQTHHASRIDALTSRAARIRGNGVVDLPTADPWLLDTLPLARVERTERALRQRLAPGLAERAPLWIGLLLLGSLALGWLCGPLLSRLLDTRSERAGIAIEDGLAATDPARRMARIAARRQRETRDAKLRRIAAWLVPGAAGHAVGRPGAALVATLLVAAAVVLGSRPAAFVPDSGVALRTSASLFTLTAVLAALGYLAALFLLRALDKEQA